jgi:hypothetical protein
LNLLFCPGYHDSALSQRFLSALHLPPAIALYLYPAPNLPPYSPHHILQFLDAQNINPEQQFIIMGFSAGVVGAIATAHIWQRLGGKIPALIALDGWGVPLFADFPIYRLSHDRFTHETSRLLGRGNLDFYADPPVEHLALLRSPHQVAGWSESPDGSGPRQSITAQDFLYNIIINNINESC